MNVLPLLLLSPFKKKQPLRESLKWKGREWVTGTHTGGKEHSTQERSEKGPVGARGRYDLGCCEGSPSSAEVGHFQLSLEPSQLGLHLVHQILLVNLV